MDSLEEQLEKLQMITNQQLTSSASLKKIGPAVPPKPKKSQPQVFIRISEDSNRVEKK